MKYGLALGGCDVLRPSPPAGKLLRRDTYDGRGRFDCDYVGLWRGGGWVVGRAGEGGVCAAAFFGKEFKSTKTKGQDAWKVT